MSTTTDPISFTAEPRHTGLLRQPHVFSLFQALRNIESLHDDAPRLGFAPSPSQEKVRIAQLPSLEFAPNTIDSCYLSSEGILQLTQRAFGMLGVHGALPMHLTELIRNRTRHAQDRSTQAFLDLFHHRMALLFYRAWSSSRPAIQRDLPTKDRFSLYIGAWAGFGLKQARKRDALPDETKWFFAGQFAAIRRNAEGLAAMASCILGCAAEVRPFQLTQLPVEDCDKTRLGAQANSLGLNALVGERIPDRQSCFELKVGPLGYDQFQSLLPGERQRERLKALVRNYCGLGLLAKLRVVIDKQSAPRLQLGSAGQLGRNAWLFSTPPTDDLSDYSQMLELT